MPLKSDILESIKSTVKKVYIEFECVRVECDEIYSVDNDRFKDFFDEGEEASDV